MSPLPLQGHLPHLPLWGPRCPLETGRSKPRALQGRNAPELGPPQGVPAVTDPSREQEGPTAPPSPTPGRPGPAQAMGTPQYPPTSPPNPLREKAAPSSQWGQEGVAGPRTNELWGVWPPHQHQWGHGGTAQLFSQ